MNVLKICIQTGDIVDRLGIKKGYSIIKRAGFEAVDWNLDHAWNGSDIRKGTYKGKCIFEKSLEEVKDRYACELSVIRENGLIITQAHAPFPAYSVNCPEVLDYAIEIYKRNIEYCDAIGCKNLVIHGIPLSMTDEINTVESIRQLNLKLYTSLIPVLLKCNVTVCLENLFTNYRGVMYRGHCGDAYQAAAFIDELNALAGKEVFGLCLDTGHQNLLKMDFRESIPVLNKRIKALHIHDNDAVTDLHMAPLTGTVRWDYFCASLKSIGYDGDLDFETFNQTNKVLDFDEELLLPWMKLICKTGKVFKKRIEG